MNGWVAGASHVSLSPWIVCNAAFARFLPLSPPSQHPLARVGCRSQVTALRETIQKSKTTEEAKREAQHEKQMEKRVNGMRMRQRARYLQLQTAQQEAQAELKTAHSDEVATLLEEQAEEVHAIMESVTAMIALGSHWAPLPKWGKAPWMMQLRKWRFHPSKELTEMHGSISKLTQLSQTACKLGELTHRAARLEKHEKEAWQAKLMKATMGSDSSSVLSQLLAQHKLAQSKMHDFHTRKIANVEKADEAALKALEGKFRLERLNLTESAKARAVPPPSFTQLNITE